MARPGSPFVLVAVCVLGVLCIGCRGDSPTLPGTNGNGATAVIVTGPTPAVGAIVRLIATAALPDGTSTVPGLSFFGDPGRGCNSITGQFTIVNVVYAGDGSVQQLRVDFEQHCENQGPALRGTLSFVR